MGRRGVLDLELDVRESVARIEASPFIPEKGSVRGFVYDVHTGRSTRSTEAGRSMHDGDW